jgi:hypothetical protein
MVVAVHRALHVRIVVCAVECCSCLLLLPPSLESHSTTQAQSIAASQWLTLMTAAQSIQPQGWCGSNLEACEDAVVVDVIAIAMKLCEHSLKSLFTRLVYWGFDGISFADDGVKPRKRANCSELRENLLRARQFCCRHAVMF